MYGGAIAFFFSPIVALIAMTTAARCVECSIADSEAARLQHQQATGGAGEYYAAPSVAAGEPVTSAGESSAQ